jgi:pimeloyl-ACP methyl ester carboxylesterase
VVLPHDEVGLGDAVVLLHAGIADRTMWEEHLPAVAAAGYRAIAIDLPGFGEAPVAESDPWLDVLATMDALQVDRAALVGSSYGGAVALRVALTAPGRVPALALVSAPTPTFAPSPELEAAWGEEEAALERGDIEAAVESVLDTWTLPDAPPALRERVAAMQRHAFELQIAAATEPGDPLDIPPTALADLAMPTLIAVGELDKPEFHACAHDLAHARGSGDAVVIPGAGHLAPLEQPGPFRALLLDFLRDRHPATTA